MICVFFVIELDLAISTIVVRPLPRLFGEFCYAVRPGDSSGLVGIWLSAIAVIKV